MLIDNYDILDTLEEHAEINEEGKKVIPINYVKYMLQYYFNYPVHSKEKRALMTRNVDGDIKFGRAYPDKTIDVSIEAQKKVIFESIDLGTEVEKAAVYKAIEEIATQIGLALMDKDLIKLYVMNKDYPEGDILDGLTEAIVKGYCMFNAYLPDNEILKGEPFSKYLQYNRIHKMISEMFEKKKSEDVV